MAGHSGDDLEAVAGLLSGIADDLNSPTSEDEPMDADDLDATLRAMRHDVPDAACPVPHHGDDPPEPPPAAEPANPRAAILARARAAKAEKRLKALADARAAQVEGGTALGGSEGVLVAGSSAEPRRAPIVVPSAFFQADRPCPGAPPASRGAKRSAGDCAAGERAWCRRVQSG